MSYWNSLPPTNKQIVAIESYDKVYGVKILATSKQAAHDVISQYCPVQMLEFTEDGFVKGTSVSFEIVNPKIFQENPYNKWFKENVVSFYNEDGITHLKVKRSGHTNNPLLQLVELQSRLLDSISMSEPENDLGYLDEQGLQDEAAMYGPDPLWYEH